MVYSDNLFLTSYILAVKLKPSLALKIPSNMSPRRQATDSGWYPVDIKIEFSRTRLPEVLITSLTTAQFFWLIEKPISKHSLTLCCWTWKNTILLAQKRSLFHCTLSSVQATASNNQRICSITNLTGKKWQIKQLSVTEYHCDFSSSRKCLT